MVYIYHKCVCPEKVGGVNIICTIRITTEYVMTYIGPRPGTPGLEHKKPSLVPRPSAGGGKAWCVPGVTSPPAEGLGTRLQETILRWTCLMGRVREKPLTSVVVVLGAWSSCDVINYVLRIYIYVLMCREG